MKIKEKTARSLLFALGYENADSYSQAMLAKRLSRVEAAVPHEVRAGVKDEELTFSLKAVCAAAKRHEPIEIIGAVPSPITPITYTKEEQTDIAADDWSVVTSFAPYVTGGPTPVSLPA